MNQYTIGNLPLDGRTPKIIVSLTGTDISTLKKELDLIKNETPDLLEWRMDCFKEKNSPFEVIELIKANCPTYPLIATFRTSEEGGEGKLTQFEYLDLYRKIIEHGEIDAIDLELTKLDADLLDVIRLAKNKHICIILSKHDFLQTPDVQSLIRTADRMYQYGADIAKMAVMPSDYQDIIKLLQASTEIKIRHQRPLLTIAMGEIGALTRIMGSHFGSDLTFASLLKPSAPGQIPIKQLRELMNLLVAPINP